MIAEYYNILIKPSNELREYIKNIENASPTSLVNNILNNEAICTTLHAPKYSNDYFLTFEDLQWINSKLETERRNGNKKYLHELLEGSITMLPVNKVPDRNPQLEERCKRLKIQQDNLKYRTITKNVDNIRLKETEETLAYQIKQINKQLIAVAQFVVSTLAGFAFGFIGLPLLFEKLDIGLRLLFGILIAIIVGVADLYFLLKQL